MILTSFKGVAEPVATVVAWLVVLNILSRPGVAGNVLQTPVIQLFIQLSFFPHVLTYMVITSQARKICIKMS